MGLQMISPAAIPAGAVAHPYDLRPLLARPATSESLFGAAVYVVGVVLADIPFREDSGLRYAPPAGFRTGGAVAAPVLASLIDVPADLAEKLVGPRIRQRLVDRVQEALVPADGPDVTAEVFACLEMRAKGATGFGHHGRVCLFARSAAKPPVRGVFSAPPTVVSDHKNIIRRSRSAAP